MIRTTSSSSILKSLDWSLKNHQAPTSNEDTNDDHQNDSSSSSILQQLLDTGAGMPQHSHINKIYGNIIDGVYLGSMYGLDELVQQCNIKLVLRMNAGSREPHYRILRRPFETSKLVSASDAKTSNQGKGVKVSLTMKKDQQQQQRDEEKPTAAGSGFHEGTVTKEEFYSQLHQHLFEQEPPKYSHEWRFSPIFVRAVPALDEPGFNMYPFFEEMTSLMELVLQGRKRYLEKGGIAKDRVEEFLRDEAAAKRKKNDGDDDNEKKPKATTSSPAVRFGPQPGLSSNNNFLPTVAVHCVQGVSRSASIVCAYLMKKVTALYSTAEEKGDGKSSSSSASSMSAVKEFIKKMKTKRHCVEPNSGFVRQLQRWHATSFLPLHRPKVFARELVGKVRNHKSDDGIDQQQQRDRIAELMTKVLATFITTHAHHHRHPLLLMDHNNKKNKHKLMTQEDDEDEDEERAELDFFELVECVQTEFNNKINNSNKTTTDHGKEASSSPNLLDPLKLMMKGLDDVLRDEIDVDSPFVLSVWGNMMMKYFSPMMLNNHADENDIDETLSNYRNYVKANRDDFCRHFAHHSSSIQNSNNINNISFCFSDSVLRHVIFSKILYTKENSKSIMNNDPSLLISRALKLCRLNRTNEGITDYHYQNMIANRSDDEDRSSNNRNNRIIIDRLLEPVCANFRTSFSFLPILVLSNINFWQDVADFLQNNCGTDTDTDHNNGLKVMNNLLRAPLVTSSSSNSNDSSGGVGATVSYLLQVMHQSEAPPSAPQSTTLDSVLNNRKERQQQSSNNSQQQEHQRYSHHQTNDPEIDLFVYLLRHSAFNGDNVVSYDKFVNQLLKNWILKTKEIQSWIFVPTTTTRSEENNNKLEIEIENIKYQLFCEKVVGALVACLIVRVSPQLEKPFYNMMKKTDEEVKEEAEKDNNVDPTISKILSELFCSPSSSSSSSISQLLMDSFSKKKTSYSQLLSGLATKWCENLQIKYDEKTCSLVWNVDDDE